MKILAVIPARGGSKGIPGKNIRMFVGKPLIAHTILLAQKCGFDRTIVSTDDFGIADIARQYGGDVPFMRPAELATDECPTLLVIRHAIRFVESQGERYDGIVILEPTAPLREQHVVEEALCVLSTGDADTVLTAAKFDIDLTDLAVRDAYGYIQPFMISAQTTTRRQDTKEDIVKIDPSVYAARRDVIMDETLVMLNPYKERLSLRTKVVPVNPMLHVEIDNLHDWEYAEWLYRKYMGGET